MLLISTAAYAETGAEAWLRYTPVDSHSYTMLPSRVVALGTSPIERSAANELARGLSSMLTRDETITPPNQHQTAIILGTLEELRTAQITLTQAPTGSEGFSITHHANDWVLAGNTPAGVLYGAFRFLAFVAQQRPLPDSLTDAPTSPLRWINQWDNFDGTIERGYAGPSIFFSNGHVCADLTRVNGYGRLLASIGINGVTVNNVNSDLRTLTPEMISEFARIADTLRPWGVRISLSLDLSSPKVVGNLPTFDPLDPAVIAWWQKTIDSIYSVIPDLAGFVVKADSEGRAGPSQYGRSPADAANVLARPLARHGGVVLYRGFVYNHHLDWNDLKADRARAGYDNFRALDGKFEPNVVIQIKNGPIDFQVREPVSPLFAALPHTAQAIELQITQEYTGQQRHMVFLVPMWKTALDTDMRIDGQHTPVSAIVEGRVLHQQFGGFVGVANVGLDANWLHHPMAMANLYGFGRLAWNPALSSEQIIDEWTRMNWGNQPQLVDTIDRLQLESWKAYEDYTGPLGVGGLTDIIGVHYGPGIESAERNGWGQWIRADHHGIGMDRTVATGTGYISQYPPELAARYESLATCPDELLLFMHHVPYNHVLHSGKTVIQHIYDSHYEGAAVAASYAPVWQRLKTMIDPERYAQVLALFTYQAGHAEVWRDAVNDWFHAESSIEDKLGRVGHHPGRIEAESMEATGYKTVPATPRETASGGKAVICEQPQCTLRTTFRSPAGRYRFEAGYFDLRTGASHYTLLINNKPAAEWIANDTLPPAVVDKRLNGHTATRFTKDPIALKPGDTIELRATPDGAEPAPVDFLQFTLESANETAP
jgi:alpha-glucuronidase